MCLNSPGVKEEGLLPRAETLSRDAGEEGDPGALQNDTLLLSLLHSTAGGDVTADPGGVRCNVFQRGREGPGTG